MNLWKLWTVRGDFTSSSSPDAIDMLPAPLCEQLGDSASSTQRRGTSDQLTDNLTTVDLDCKPLDFRCEGGTEEGGTEEGGEGGTDEGNTDEGSTDEVGSNEGRTDGGGTKKGLTACQQYERNAHTFGASWPLLCCALASKSLLNLVIAFSPISLMYNAQRSQWMQTIRFFLTRAGPHSLDLRFSDPDQLPTLGACIACCSPSLSSLRLELQGMVDLFKEQQNEHWTLTLESVTFKNVSFQFLDSISPQLHEFTLYEDNDLIFGPCLASHTLAFSFSNARLLRFRFASSELKLTLTVSPALKNLSVMAERLVLSCKTTAPLTLDHLSLYGRERLDISSLCLASARVAYLGGPERDYENEFWTKWLRTIAPTVEVLIVRHGVPIQKAYADWSSLRSLGIVVHTKGTHGLDRIATVDNYRFLTDDHDFYDFYDEEDKEEDGYDWDTGDAAPSGSRHEVQQNKNKKACAKPPTLCAPNLQFLFFPSRKACDAATLVALRQDYPALALYCVVDHSFFWERKGAPKRLLPITSSRLPVSPSRLPNSPSRHPISSSRSPLPLRASSFPLPAPHYPFLPLQFPFPPPHFLFSLPIIPSRLLVSPSRSPLPFPASPIPLPAPHYPFPPPQFPFPLPITPSRLPNSPLRGAVGERERRYAGAKRERRAAGAALSGRG
ncbi:unnamed protein product [Closterium sp. Naga37s-1]|nr:unnamed protein product [Closterium sp. Naga37s-1]